MSPDRDEFFLKLALEQAQKAFSSGEVPVGAVLTYGEDIIAAACNSPILLNDPTAHAEILVIRRASDVAGNYRLPGRTIYVTLEPCIMCAGAIIQARIARVVFGARDPKGGAFGSLYNIGTDRRFNHAMEVRGGVLERECGEILSRFFQGKRITS